MITFSHLEIYIILYVLSNYEFRFYATGCFYATHKDKDIDSTIMYDGSELKFLATPF